MTIKLSIDTDSYNDRRYGKPWIAAVDFADNPKGNFAFGDWVGQSGSSGTLYLEANVGDVIARGQKDFRKQANSAAEFSIVNEGGELGSVTKADAYKHWLAAQAKPEDNPLADISTDALLAELSRRGVAVDAI